jgi:hypothetical protein
MKYIAFAALVFAWTPHQAHADAYAFYYAECLQNAAIINALPNADGSYDDPNDHSSIVDPANPELYRYCTYRAIEQSKGRK